jgi:beta-exotoxin I transport system permease protein
VRLIALLQRSFGRARVLLLPLAAVLVLFQVLIVSVARYLRDSGAFSQLLAFLPPFVQQLAGGVFSGFGSMVAFGFFHPVVIIVFVATAIVIASEPAADVESGLVDLLLARAIGRWQLIARSLVMTLLTTTAIAGLMVAASRASTILLARPSVEPSTAVILKLAANLIALAWIMGSLSLAIAAVVRRRGAATGAAGIAALVLFFLNFLAEIWPRLRPYGPLSPFHYYQPTVIIAGGATRWATDIATLLAGAALLSLIAFVAFARRDV